MEEWFNDLFSKASGTDFNEEDVPDLFSFMVHEGDKVYAEWDITQDLLDHGMTWINYTNSSLNVSFEIAFIHRDIFEQFKNDESLEKIVELARNDSIKIGDLAQWNYVHHVYAQPFLRLMYYLQGATTFILGAVGLIVKYRASDQTRVVKVTRMTYSVWCLIAGLLMIICESTRESVFAESYTDFNGY